MTTVVLDSADLVEATLTGTIPVPRGIAEDNAAQAAKREGNDGKKTTDRGDKAGQSDVQATGTRSTDAESTQARDTSAKPAVEGVDPDDVEGEDGLTPKQKREFTKAMQATIGRKHRMQKEAEELALNQYNQAQLAEQRAEHLERELAELKAKAPQPKAEESKAPERKDFDTDQAYQDAVVEFKVDQRFKVQQAEENKRREEARQHEIVRHASARIERATELVPDFKEVTGAVDLEVPPMVASYMQESDMFAELGYYFAKDALEGGHALEDIQKMTEGLDRRTAAYEKALAKQLVAIGKIESTLQPFAPAKAANGAKPSQTNGDEPSPETGSAPSKPRVQAPIIRPLNTGSAAQVTKDEADMTGSQVVRTWERKHKVNLTARKRH
jgi:hypothetical protein